VGKWEFRGLCGISKLRGKVVFLTFPGSGFSTAPSAGAFIVAKAGPSAAQLVEEGSTVTVMAGLKEVIEHKGGSVSSQAMRSERETQRSFQMLMHRQLASAKVALPRTRSIYKLRF
jgi:hypothetical protein